jgi:hypothetical protein
MRNRPLKLDGFGLVSDQMMKSLTTKSVECSALSLQSIDNIHSSNSLPLGVLSVGDSITDDVLKENLEDTSGLLIDEARDTLNTTSPLGANF